jgi:hypothetical protein
VSIPGYVGPLTRFVDLLPQPLRDRAFRAMVPNQVTATRGSSVRSRYESQALTDTGEQS